ncbi:MAG: polysaccharide deacetylase family protein [Bacteroidetes bacterium]|nr:polysaccharide deacetylase family protein [Bacteroidota bacterium]
MQRLTIIAALLVFGLQSFAQPKNLAQKLGYPKDAKLLIVHADDAGFAHSADSAIMLAYEKGAINSASIMVTCPWFPEIAAFAKKHPEMDWGIHLSLTSEWKNYKWQGVAPSSAIPSLLDKNGYLYDSVEGFGAHAKVDEAEKEIRAQIEKAKAFGIRISHLDNHMGSILASPELMKMFQRVGKEYKLPVLEPVSYIRMVAPKLIPAIDTTGIIVDNFIMAYQVTPADKWKNFYNYSIKNLKPGLNELIFHLGFDEDELRAVCTEHPAYGSAWRQQDYDYATSDEFKALLKAEGVYLVTWGEIGKVEYGK